MISINSFDALESSKIAAESSEDPVQFDEFSQLMAAFLFTPADVKLPLKTEESIKETSELSQISATSEIKENPEAANQLFAPNSEVNGLNLNILPANSDLFRFDPKSEVTKIESKPVLDSILKQPISQTKPAENVVPEPKVSETLPLVNKLPQPILVETKPIVKDLPKQTIAEVKPAVMPHISATVDTKSNEVSSPAENVDPRSLISEVSETQLPTEPKTVSPTNLPQAKLEGKQISNIQAKDGKTNVSQPLDFEVISNGVQPEQILPVVWKPTEISNQNPITKAEFASNISQLFKGVSKELKAEKSDKSVKESNGEIIPAFSIVGESALTSSEPTKPIEAAAFAVGAGNGGEIERKSPKSIVNPNSFETAQLQSFDKLVSIAEKALDPKEPNSQIDMSEKVFKQIEAKISRETLVISPNIDKPNILKLRLRPAELGTVEIKLEKDASGKLTAHFQTETEATKQILVERFEGLQDALQNAGWQVDKLDVSTKSFSSAGGEHRDDQSRQTETRENRFSETERFERVTERKDESSTNRLVSLRA